MKDSLKKLDAALAEYNDLTRLAQLVDLLVAAGKSQVFGRKLAKPVELFVDATEGRR